MSPRGNHDAKRSVSRLARSPNRVGSLRIADMTSIKPSGWLVLGIAGCCLLAFGCGGSNSETLSITEEEMEQSLGDELAEGLGETNALLAQFGAPPVDRAGLTDIECRSGENTPKDDGDEAPFVCVQNVDVGVNSFTPRGYITFGYVIYRVQGDCWEGVNDRSDLHNGEGPVIYSLDKGEEPLPELTEAGCVSQESKPSQSVATPPTTSPSEVAPDHSASSESGEFIDCGEVVAGDNRTVRFEAQGVNCAEAGEVVRGYFLHGSRPLVGAFVCNDGVFSDDLLITTCTDGETGARVRFSL